MRILRGKGEKLIPKVCLRVQQITFTTLLSDNECICIYMSMRTQCLEKREMGKFRSNFQFQEMGSIKLDEETNKDRDV